MSDKPKFILEILDAQITIERRNVAQYKANEWPEALADASKRLDALELLYDAVDDGLIDQLRAEHQASKSRMAVAS